MNDQEIKKSTRKSLNTLQGTATNLELWLGITPQSLKHQRQHSQVSPDDEEVERTILLTKEMQAAVTNKITVEDLTNPEGPSDSYWKILTEKRQVTLQETLLKNAELRKNVEDLEAELVKYAQMLEEANSYVEVIRQEILDDKDDTGIDVNDVSTADETTSEEAIGNTNSRSNEESEEDTKN